MKVFLALLVAAPLTALEIVESSLPTALLNRPYTAEPLMAAGGGRCTANDVHFRVVFGQLPDGLRLSAAGYISGTPLRLGRFTFLVRAANDCSYTTRAFTMKVDGAPILLLSEDSLSFEYTVNGPLPAPQTLLLHSSWKDMPYSLEVEGAAWLAVHPWRGRSVTPDSPLQGDPVTIAVDPGKLAPGTYRGYLKATAWQTSNEPAIPVTLTVKPAKAD